MSNDLIARLEAATGPDRELDIEIGKLLYPDREWFREKVRWMAGQYTGSLDAAITLIPDGWRTISAEELLVKGFWTWCLKSNDPVRGGSAQGEYRFGFGKNAEIAICIAALRARGLV